VTNKKIMAPYEKDAQQDVDRITKIKKRIDVDLPEETSDLLEYVTKLENENSINTAKRGLAYLMLKERLGHGEFGKALAERDISKQRAQEAMSVARMLMTLPPAKTKAFTLLGGSKLIELARIPVESLAEIVETDELDLDAIDRMSVRELKQKLRKARHDLEKAEMREEQARASASQAQTPAGFQYPPSIDRVRVESSVLAKQATLHLDDIEQLMTELAAAPDLSDDRNKAQTEYSAGATTLFVNLQAVYTKAAYLMHWFRETIGDDYVPIDLDNVPVLTDDEAVRALAMRDYLLAESRADKIVRENRRGQKKRGRPRKVK